LYTRAVFTEIGHFSGNVSALDRDIAESKGLRPLSRFERWLLKPIIKEEKADRRDAFRSACQDILGEDPDEDWVYSAEDARRLAESDAIRMRNRLAGGDAEARRLERIRKGIDDD
jgi:hypothetical protein